MTPSLLDGLAAGIETRSACAAARQSRISSAGPEAKAEARKRGARIAVIQKERPGKPL